MTIPEGVPSIGDYAFYNCTSLASVTIPEGVTRIGFYAFVDCTSLASVTIPEGVESIGDYAFMNCNSLESVTIPEGVESIGTYAFMNCTSLESVTILESVASIGEYVFAGCINLKTLTIPCTLNIDDAGVPSGTPVTMIHDWENGACKNCKETCQHTGGTATCTDKAVCTNCGSAYGTLDFGNHAGTLTKTEAKAPTCQQDGNVEYWTCSACNKNFSDSAGQTELTSTVDKALGHDFSGSFDAFDENGHWHICNRAGCGATDTPAAHSFTNYVSDNNATCDKDGTETAKCDDCSAENTKTDAGSATGHNYGEATYTWTDNGSACTASRTCENDQSHVEKATGSVTSQQTKAPTCTDKGETTYTATFAASWATEQIKKLTDIDATGHSLTRTEAKAATHTAEDNIEYWYCSVCKKYFSDENAEAKITLADTVIAKLADHTADLTKWEKDDADHWHLCECGAKLNKAAHTFVWVIDKEATTAEKGEKHEECSVCGYKKAPVEIPVISTYPPKVETPEGGVAEVTPKDPQEGDKVTVTPTPDEGYETVKVTVTDEDGKEIAVVEHADGTYSYVQPDGPVTVKVLFAPVVGAIDLPMTGDPGHTARWAALLLSGAALAACVRRRRAGL